MVAVLLRLRFRILRNTLGRNTFQLVAVVAGGAWSVLVVAVVLIGLVFVSQAPPDVVQAVVVIGGTVLVGGWLIVPLLFDGVDRTLDPPRLARYPLRVETIMTADVVAGLAWIPGILTLAVSVGTCLAWLSSPAAAVAAVPAGIVGALICVVGSRLTTAVAGTLLRGRGAIRFAVAALGLVAVIGPLGAALTGAGRGGSVAPGGDAAAIVGVLGWLPFGAVWSVAGRIAAGDVAGAALAAAIGIGTVVALLVLWRLTMVSASRVRGDSRRRAHGAARLGVFGGLPATPAGAIAARSLVYWFRDGRQARQLLLVPLLPALMLLWWLLFDLDAIALATGPVVAAILPLSAFAAISYDGTAFAAELAAGVRGRDDRLGRAVALLAIGLPATIAVQTAVAVIAGRAADLPALLGISIGTLLTAIGVVSVSSARVVVPVARSGRNPFSAQPGAATVSILASYGVALATVLLLLPVLATGLAAFVTGLPAIGWATLGAGLVLGSAVAVGGVVVGGALLDRSGPALLARLRLVRD